MRTIHIPEKAIRRLLDGPITGTVLSVPVAVNWPELQLTEEQIMANAWAAAWGKPFPYPDRSIFAVDLPFVLPRYPK